MPQINPDRLLGDLKTLREFGRHGTGVVRQALSTVDMASRHWLVERMTDAGLEASIDGLGTVIGRSRNPGKALLLGSHTDTQPTGGWLDGAMGVMYGLEVARALAESDDTRGLALDVASWVDEEGAFIGLMGSKAFCGVLDDDALAGAVNGSGQTLPEALREAGLKDRVRCTLDPAQYTGYLEAHIEQGPYLEEEGQRIGVVTSIVGIRNHRITFEGEQNHAGTTPMPRRKDAGRALTDFASTVHEKFPEQVGSKSVWTIGEIHLEPGASSIVPGRAWMTLQFRDGEESRLDRLTELVHKLVEEADARGPVRVRIEAGTEWSVAAQMDEGLRAHLQAAAETHATGAWMHMPSAAGHDAQVLAKHLPSAMLFVPSIGGISHAFEEDTSEADIVLGCQVLADAAASILGAKS